ncbi:type II secretion system protein [Peribacillus acanthi]|uniref:type II secretion system protein n=1 Tax=Peribacillus acanthi TaxID=2171554 RepID=UPI000D3E1913|nr:hypothetical protein [Peribacillus acanthi]
MIVRNNKGVTLVGVLLITVIISILAVTLTSMIVNNMHQIKRTEKGIQVNDVAEMGIQYQSIHFSDFYHIRLTEIISNVKSKIITDYNNKALNTNEFYEETIAKDLVDSIKGNGLFFSHLPNTLLLSKNIDPNDKRKFEIIFENPSTDLKCPTCGDIEPGESIRISFLSKGTGDNFKGEKKIKSTLNMEIGAITIDLGPGNGGGTGGNTLPPSYETIITAPINLPQCTNLNNFGSKDCSYKGSVTINDPSDISNVDILIEGSLVAYKPINKGIENSTLYVKGSADFNDPINGISNSFIYIGGAAEFKNINQGIVNTTIVVIGSANFNVNGNINGMSNSSIYVKGNANFNDKHINGFDSSAKICVGGTVSGVPSGKNYNIYSPTKNNALFIEKCGRPGGLTESGIDIGWDIDTSDITYEYN